MFEQSFRDWGFEPTRFDAVNTLTNSTVGTTKTRFHIDGCACAGCHAHDEEGKSFAPGGDTPGMTDTVGDTTGTAGTLAPGTAVESAIDTNGDSDWFAIDLTAGQTYTFTVYLPGGGLPDSTLTLRNSSGTQVAFNDDANTSAALYWSEIIYTAPTSGTYYLDVRSFGGQYTGGYFLSSSRPTNDDIGDTVATAGSINVGQSITSELNQNGDRDWFAVTLEAGQAYEFTTSAPGGGSDLIDSTLTVRDASGNVLAYNDDNGGRLSGVRFTAATSGTYYIDVGAWVDNYSGDYTLTAAEAVPLQEFNNDQIADQLLSGYWGGAERRFNVTQGGSISVDITGLTAAGQFLARESLALWSDVLGVSFQEVSGGAQITFDDEEDGAFARSFTSGGFITSSEVNISTDWLANSGTTLDSYSFQTYLHEIGHALGLGHGGNYNSTASYAQDASYLNDSWATTVMSYFSQSANTFFNDQGFSRVFTLTPMSADIVAIQTAYGEASTTRTENNTYGVGNNTGRTVYGISSATTNGAGQLLAFTIIDHGGVDTLNYSSFSASQLINLNQETFSNIGGSIGNMSIARGTIIENAIGGSGRDQIIGTNRRNELTGGLGNDEIDGGGNIDTAIVSGNRSAYTVTQIDTGVFRVVGADGTDTLTNVEYLRFDDETMRLRPGTGLSVNFGPGDPSLYQAAMNNIRDFAGNDLPGDGSWQWIGEVDVNGDGDVDQILVNDVIGRFATVGTAPDGLVYFDDHGWAGETRVAGIYIDPLVTNGTVEAGGPNDSQRRFRADLRNENIDQVLGADDFNGDGIQEVYFSLANGTAYLRALMHADGNIRYANYQNEQQLIDYLTRNGYDESTYGDWLYGSDAQAQQSEAGMGDAAKSSDPVADPLRGDKVAAGEPANDTGDAGNAAGAGSATGSGAGSGAGSGSGSGSGAGLTAMGGLAPEIVLAGGMALPIGNQLLEQQQIIEFYG